MPNLIESDHDLFTTHRNGTHQTSSSEPVDPNDDSLFLFEDMDVDDDLLDDDGIEDLFGVDLGFQGRAGFDTRDSNTGKVVQSRAQSSNTGNLVRVFTIYLVIQLVTVNYF